MKQVLIFRHDLKMPKGKLAAQAGHAAMAFVLHGIPVPKEWVATGQKKVCLRVDTLDELMSLKSQAIDLGVHAFLVEDAGKTCFTEPTITCLALGPAKEAILDHMTNTLKLL